MEFLLLLVIAGAIGYILYNYKVSKKNNEDVVNLVEEVKTEEVKSANVEVVVSNNETLVADTAQPVVEVKSTEKVETKAKPKKTTPKAKVASTRSRNKGKFVGDDKTTPEVNEAFIDGKSPAKKKKPNIKVAD